jgi:hypothetical protein
VEGHGNLESLRRELEATAAISDLTQQMMEVAAIVDEALTPLNIHPVVVGGLAIAYWVPGAYLTSDIDVVMPYVQSASERLAELGFTREGRFWVLPGREVFFEAPGSQLEPSPEGYEVVVLESGRSVRVQAPEEVLLLRLAEFVSEGKSEVFQQCLWLLGATAINRDRLDERATQEGLGAALKALEPFVEIVEGGGDLPPSWELQELAKRLQTR